MSFTYKTKPFKHQSDEFDVSKDLPARGLLWEMGTGKSKTTIDTTSHLALQNAINGMFIVAPSGVHRNWIDNELPAHMIDEVRGKAAMHSYSSEKASTKYHEKAVERLLGHDGFGVLAMSYDALVTKKGAAVAKDFLTSRRCMYVADEARRIKTPGADRTKYVLKSSKLAPYKRLLNGTPVPNGPFDLYSQMLFLDENFWHPLGISNFTSFKSFFGVFIKGYCHGPGGQVREFPQLVSYRNIDKLHGILDRLCTRVTKEDVLDLPPKLYSRREFELNAEQKRFYAELSENFMVLLQSGDMISAPLALTRLLRFQQIASGYVPVDGAKDEHQFLDIGGDNPRLKLLAEIVEDVPHKCIIWCRFRRTIDKVMAMLGEQAVRYDGTTNDDERAAAMLAFENAPIDKCKFFVANAATAGEGLTLISAKTVIYVENTYDLAARLQSEDRAHRIGQDMPVNYIDLVAAGTVDEHVTTCLQKKLDIAAQITGDRVRSLGGSLPLALGIKDVRNDTAEMAAMAIQDIEAMFRGRT